MRRSKDLPHRGGGRKRVSGHGGSSFLNDFKGGRERQSG